MTPLLVVLSTLSSPASAGKNTSLAKLDVTELKVAPAGSVCAGGDAQALVVEARLADGTTVSTKDGLNPKSFDYEATTGKVSKAGEITIENLGLAIVEAPIAVTVTSKKTDQVAKVSIEPTFGCATSVWYGGDAEPTLNLGKILVANMVERKGTDGASGAAGGERQRGGNGQTGGPGPAGFPGHDLVIDVGTHVVNGQELTLVSITDGVDRSNRTVLLDGAHGGKLTVNARGGVGGFGGQGGQGGLGGMYGDGGHGGDGGVGGPGGPGGHVIVRYETGHRDLADLVTIDTAGGAGGGGGPGGAGGALGTGGSWNGDPGTPGPAGPDGPSGQLEVLEVPTGQLFEGLALR